MQGVLDRESPDAVYGTFILGITATEVERDGRLGQSITTEVTIIVTVRGPMLRYDPQVIVHTNVSILNVIFQKVSSQRSSDPLPLTINTKKSMLNDFK